MKALFLTVLSLLLTLPAMTQEVPEPAQPATLPSESPATLETNPSPVSLVDLKIENRTSPTIAATQPRFSWTLESDQRGQRQGSYQIQIAESVEKLTAGNDLLWDSNKTASSESHLVKTTAPALPEEKLLHWRVRIWNHDDKLSAWSEPAHFTISQKASKEALAKEPRVLSHFECSDAKLNELFLKARELRLKEFSKLRSGATHLLCARAFAYDAHIGPLYQDWLTALDKAQGQDKLYPAFIPSREGEAQTAPGYSDAAVVVPFALWQMTGDDQYIRDRFQPLVDYLGKRRELDADFRGKAFGTFIQEEADEMSHQLFSLATFALDCRMMSDMATAMEHPPYILQHNAWFDNLRKGFEKHFLNEDKTLKHDTQTTRIIALRYGLLPPAAKLPMAKALGKQIRAEGLKTGPFGRNAVLPVLTWTEQNELAAELARKVDADKADLVTLSCTSEWLMSFIAGLNHQSPGFRSIRIAPYPVFGDSPLTSAKAHHDTPYGRLAIDWKITEDSTFHAKVTIPCNTNGIISLPGDKDATVLESGKSIDESYGARFMRDAEGRKEIIAQPGTYQFEVRKTKK